MNPQGTSFIPQRPTQGKIKNRGVRKIYVLAYISYVFFFGTALAAAGVFFYSITLDKQLNHQIELLSEERSKFSQSDIESIRELEHRINIAKDRMDKHISVVSVFEAIEKSAVQSLQFVSFSYKRQNDDAPVITLTGNTDRFNGVLFQREVLQTNPILAGGTFTEIALASLDEKDGEAANVRQIITFELNKTVSPSLIQYSPRFAQQSVSQEVSQQEEVIDENGEVVEGDGEQIEAQGEVSSDDQEAVTEEISQ